MQRIYTLLFFLLLATSGIASGINTYQIKGKISNTSGVPISFASIAILNTSKGTVADINGQFSLNFNSPRAKVTLVISSIGFKKKEIQLVLGGKRTITLKEKLENSVEKLNEVVINAESKSTLIERQGFAVSSVETRDLEMQSININHVLDQTSGVRVRQSGGLGSHTRYNINGLSGSAVRIFIDGVPMEYFGASYSLSSIPISLIERVDVYKGVVPVELGNDALGGAINIVTKKKTQKAINASYSAGSFNTHRATFSLDTRQAKTGLSTQLSAFYNYSDNNYPVWSNDVILINDDRTSPEFGSITRGVKVRRFHDAYESYGANFKLGFIDKKWADSFFVGLNTSKMEKDHQHGATMMVPFGERRSNDKMYMPSISYTKKNIFTEGLDIKAFASYTYRERQLIDTTSNTYNWLGKIVTTPKPTSGEGRGASLNTNTNKTYMGRLFLSYHISDNTELGLNYMFTNFNRSSDDPLSVPAVRQFGTEYLIKKHIVGASIQNQSFEDKLISSAFVKYYGNNVGIDKAEYNASNNSVTPYSYKNYKDHYGYGITSVYALTPIIRLSLSAEKAIRLPGPNEIFGNVADDIVATNDLKPEQSQNFNFGLIIGSINMGLHRLDLNTNFFYRNTIDKLKRILGESSGERNMYVYQNLGKTLSKGLDLNIDYSYNNIFKLAAYTSYLDSRFKEKQDQYGNRYLHYNAREPNTPYFTAGGNTSYLWQNPFGSNGALTLSWTANYVHNFYLKWETYGSQNKAIIPSQFINDCGIAYQFPNKKISVSVDCKNLTNRLAFDYYAIQKPGRAFYAKLSFQL